MKDSTGEARFARKAEAAEVEVRLRVDEGMFHCYPLLTPMFPEAVEAMEAICEFIHTQLERQTDRTPVKLRE